jgi:hypothetical protein
MALVDLAEADMHQAAGGQAEALRDQIEVVVVNPDGGEVVRHAERHGVLRGFECTRMGSNHIWKTSSGNSPLKSHLTVSQRLGRTEWGMTER